MINGFNLHMTHQVLLKCPRARLIMVEFNINCMTSSRRLTMDHLKRVGVKYKDSPNLSHD